jgi:hypothetical protein
VDQMRLIFGGRQLADGRTLEYYNVKEGAIMHLVERQHGC